MTRLRVAAAFLLLLGGIASAQTAPPGTDAGSATAAPQNGADSAGADFDPTRFIGLDVKSALDALGAPQAVFPFRGQEEAQDNVVFFYRDFLYLFWYKDRVWQVRCDRRFARPLFGLAMGMPRDVVQRTVARQLVAKGDSLYFDLDDAKYPVRVRLVFANDALSDIYIYRGDF
ncbi:MAG TPA: hypothetical protein VMM82_03445 [Spirochaetia bacterium]|nr:hypothetical protein [Spirochaetia bacterium]